MFDRLFNSERCYHGGLRHNFKPRVTEEATAQISSETASMVMHAACVGDEVEALEALRGSKETYHGDVCTWCGKVVNAPGKSDAPMSWESSPGQR